MKTESPVNSTTQLLSTMRVGEIPEEESPQRWLIENLWGISSVGMIGGCPKLGKSWLGLDMAVSVATGTPCLGVFPVKDPGLVLVYLAEDALPILRERVAGLARHRNLEIDRINIHVITESLLRLDQASDRKRLIATATKLRPRMVLLDPLVRLHSANENDAKEIAQLLSYFRNLQRELDTSVVLVHHTRKNSSGSNQGGQSLRGSSDFWAFGDSNLYLRKVKNQVVLSMEHRAAAAPDPVNLQLVATNTEAVHLEVIGVAKSDKQQRECDLTQNILVLLKDNAVLPRNQIRKKLSVKNERLGRILNKLKNEDLLEQTAKGWQRTANPQPFPVPPIRDEIKGTAISPSFSSENYKNLSPSFEEVSR